MAWVTKPGSGGVRVWDGPRPVDSGIRAVPVEQKASVPNTPRVCADCNAPITRRAKRCRSCLTKHRNSLAHGTVAAYSRHRRRKEEPCDPCKEAMAAYDRQWKAAHQNYCQDCGTLISKDAKRCRPCSNAAQPTSEHGTRARYMAHLRADEMPCDPCKEAKRAYDRAAYQSALLLRNAKVPLPPST